MHHAESSMTPWTDIVKDFSDLSILIDCYLYMDFIIAILLRQWVHVQLRFYFECRKTEVCSLKRDENKKTLKGREKVLKLRFSTWLIWAQGYNVTCLSSLSVKYGFVLQC